MEFRKYNPRLTILCISAPHELWPSLFPCTFLLFSPPFVEFRLDRSSHHPMQPRDLLLLFFFDEMPSFQLEHLLSKSLNRGSEAAYSPAPLSISLFLIYSPSLHLAIYGGWHYRPKGPYRSQDSSASRKVLESNDNHYGRIFFP